MVAKDILQVLYAPHKIFKKIVQNPSYLGPFLLLVVYVLAQVGGAYVVASHSYLETTAPSTLPFSEQADLWTENAAFWRANDNTTISNNTADYINSTYAISSVEFTASDINNIWMELTFDEPANCGTGGFQNFSFRVKQLSPDAEPENVSLYLYSLGSSNFYYDLTSEFSNSDVNIWNNVTVTIGDNSKDWVANGASATWENITGLKLDFTWTSSLNIDLRIDGLFLKGKYEAILDLDSISYLGNAALNAFAPFLFEWLLLTGLMYVMIKGLKGNVVWRPLMVAVGFSLIVIVIQSFLVVAIYTTLPDLYYPLEALIGPLAEYETAYQGILDSIATITSVSAILQIAVYLWTLVLGTLVVRAVTGGEKIAEQPYMERSALEAATKSKGAEFGWIKCLAVSGASLFVTIIILGFLFGI